MKLWSICLAVILCVTQSEADWNEYSPLILNKKGNKFSFPQYIGKTPDGQSIRYVDPEDQGTTTYVFCTSEKYMRALTGEPYASSSTSQPIKCPKPVEALQEEITTEEGYGIPCGTIEEKNGTRYRVYYKLREIIPHIAEIEFETTLHQPMEGESKPRYKSHSVQLYQYCFHSSTKEILHAEYTIENPQLINSELLQDEQTHTFEPVAMDYTGVIKYYQNNYYNVPRMVGMPEFMPFALMRKPLYRYDVAAPLNEELDEMWSEFISNLRKKISKKTHPIKVHSGVYERKRVHGSSQYLDKDSTLQPSPYAFWILLYNENHTQGISFILHNYAFDYFEERHEKLCNLSICTEAGLGDSMPNPREYNYTMLYCCPSSAITNLYPFKKVKNDEIFKFEEK